MKFFTLLLLVGFSCVGHAQSLLDGINSGACPRVAPQVTKNSNGEIIEWPRTINCFNEYANFYKQDFNKNCPSTTNCPVFVLPDGRAKAVTGSDIVTLLAYNAVIDEVVAELSVIWKNQEHIDRLGIKLKIYETQFKRILFAIGLAELALRYDNPIEVVSEFTQDMMSRMPLGGRTLSGGGNLKFGRVDLKFGDGNPTVGIFQVSHELAYDLEDRYLKHTRLATYEKLEIADEKRRRDERNSRIRGELPDIRKNTAVAAANILHLLLTAHTKGFNLLNQPGLVARYYNRGIGHMSEVINQNTAAHLSAYPFNPRLDYSKIHELIPTWDSYAYYVESNWPLISKYIQ